MKWMSVFPMNPVLHDSQNRSAVIVLRERGLVDPALHQRHLTSDDAATWHVMLWGPPPMMDVAERAVSDRGVPLHRIHPERFDIGAAGAVGQRSIQVGRLVTGRSLVMLAAAALFAL
jgi:ferredoxin-NADP reductase